MTSPESGNDDVAILVQCPSCDSKVAWIEENLYRPFCSESCKNKDFVGWANEERRVAGSSVYNDVFSEDIISGGPTGLEE